MIERETEMNDIGVSRSVVKFTLFAKNFVCP